MNTQYKLQGSGTDLYENAEFLRMNSNIAIWKGACVACLCVYKHVV